jgi:hypothetical protein
LRAAIAAKSAAIAAKRAAVAAIGAARSALIRGVPELNADVLGFFRFFYAAFLFLAMINRPLVLEAGRAPDAGELGWRWLGWMASRPELMGLIEIAIMAALLLFAIGLCTRIAYAVVAAGLAVWILVWIESQRSNAHLWLVMLFMVVCLIPVPWGAALSVDEALRRRRGAGNDRRLRGKIYGYAVWMPGLILGTVWASAAYEKLQPPWLAWIFGGAVKYHWVIDAERAPVHWGLWIASHHWAAVAMSFCAVWFEAMFIVSVFLRPGRWRALFASTGPALLIGFYLFHGVLWWTWWLAMLSFIVPWASLFDFFRARVRAIAKAAPDIYIAPPPAPRGLRPVHILLIVLVCMHAMFRLPAGFGRFGSYANTYASTDEFDMINPLDPIDRLWVGYGTATAVEVESKIAVNAILMLARGDSLPPEYAGGIKQLDTADDMFRGAPRRLTLTRDPRTFDWKNGQFNPPGPTKIIGTLDVDSMALVTH